MRALLRHPENNPKGKLPLEILEPEWLADPFQQTKVVANRSMISLHSPNLRALVLMSALCDLKYISAT